MTESVAAPARPTEHGEEAGLKRELSVLGAVALSVGIMAPTTVLALNGAGAAAQVGRAVPFVFVLGALGTLAVSYSFIRMSRYVSHAGSMFAFTGVALGPRAGLVTGWTLFGVYVMLSTAACAGAALFAQATLADIGILENLDWIVLVFVFFPLAFALCQLRFRQTARILLVAEAVTIGLVIVLLLIIYIKLFAGTAPAGTGFSLDPFVPVEGTPGSAIALGIVFAFLAFAGFEGAATLGEETADPKRNIGRAIRWTVLFAAGLFVLGMLAESLGFGIDRAGVKAFAGSGSPLGDLGRSYVDQWYATLVDAGAMASMFAATLGATAAGSRMLFSLARDGLPPRRLAETSARGEPVYAMITCVVFGLAALIFIRLNTDLVVDAFFWAATIAVLGLMLCYIATNIGALRFVILRRRAPLWEGLIPILGSAFTAYVIYKLIYPVPESPFNLFPYIVAAWVVLGSLILATNRRMVTSAGEDMAAAAAESELPATART